MRLVGKVRSAGKDVCDLEGGGLAAGRKSLGTADSTSEQTGWSLWLLPALISERGELGRGVVLFSWALRPHGDAASSAFGMLAKTRPALISTTGT